MLSQHHIHRAALGWQSIGCHGFEQHAFFFAMVTAIGKILDEIRCLQEKARSQGLTLIEAGSGGL
jgi:hypothetical protein